MGFCEVENEVFSGGIRVVGNNELNVGEVVGDGFGKGINGVRNEVNNLVFAVLVFVSDKDDGILIDNERTVEVAADALEALANLLGEIFGTIAFVEVLDGIVVFVVKFAFVLVKTDVRISVLILFVKSVAEKLDGVETVGIYGVGSNSVNVFVDMSLDVRPYVSVGVNRNPLFSTVNPNVNVSGLAGGCAESTVLDVALVIVSIRS